MSAYARSSIEMLLEHIRLYSAPNRLIGGYTFSKKLCEAEVERCVSELRTRGVTGIRERKEGLRT